jgi:surface carbohydrate biosynthesis protein
MIAQHRGLSCGIIVGLSSRLSTKQAGKERRKVRPTIDSLSGSGCTLGLGGRGGSLPTGRKGRFQPPSMLDAASMDARQSEDSRSAGTRRAQVCYAWEHMQREFLAGLTLLKELESRGHGWRTERVYQIGSARHDGECVLVPFHYDAQDTNKWLYRLTNRPVRVLNLAYEQMHPLCAREYVVPSGPFAVEELNHLAWGERFKALLLDAGIPDQNIHLTGHPRFDLYANREALKSRSSLAEEYELDASKPWFLFPCNFNFAYVNQSYVEGVRQRGYHVTDEFIAGFAKARDAFMAMICEVARACEDVEIIVRVHPAGFESDALYSQKGSNFPQIKTIGDYDLAHWICQSEAVVVWNSTSSMEAMVAGVPVISFDTEGFGQRFDYDVNKILPTFNNADSVIDLLRSLSSTELSYDWECFDGWYKHRDGKNAKRIVSVVENIMSRPPGNPKGLSRYIKSDPWRLMKDTVRGSFQSEATCGRQPFTQTQLAHALKDDHYGSLQHILK